MTATQLGAFIVASAVIIVIPGVDAVFFLTFLRQFVAPGPDATAQTAALGLLFCAIAGSWFVIYILALGRLAPWLGQSRVRLVLERVTGAILVGLGLRLAAQR